MEEFLKNFASSLNVVLGAICALGGALIQSRISEKSKKKSLLSEKLESAYKLSQLVYEGHRKEIINAKKYLPHNTEGYLQERNHPGNEMSELRMLVKSYSRDLVNELERFGDAHGNLKRSFRELDVKVVESQPVDPKALDEIYTQWKNDLDTLGDASKQLKIKLSDKLNDLVK